MVIERRRENTQSDNQETDETWRPEYVLIDKDFNVYWSIKDAMETTDLSRVRVQELVREGRIEGVRPSGREWFISMDSLREYEESGLPKPGSRSSG